MSHHRNANFLSGIRRSLAAFVLAGCALGTLPAQATILKFETSPAIGGNSYIPDSYGDGVTTTSRVEDDLQTWIYAQGNAFTPNITTSYQQWTVPGNGGTLIANFLYAYTSSGDLGTAAYSGTADSTAEISLTPQAGYQVQLNSFDLVSYAGGEYPNQPIRVYDSSYNLLADYGPEDIGAIHTHIAANLTSSGTLHIQYGDNYNVGLNNLDFDQVALPEPTTFALGLSAAAFLCVPLMRRRKLRQ